MFLIYNSVCKIVLYLQSYLQSVCNNLTIADELLREDLEAFSIYLLSANSCRQKNKWLKKILLYNKYYEYYLL